MRVSELMAALSELLKLDGGRDYHVVLTTVSGVEHKLEAVSWGDKKLYLEGAEEGATYPFRCSDPLGPDCHDDRCPIHYAELSVPSIYEAILFGESEEGDRFRIWGGRLKAESEEHAREQVIEAHWDEQLRKASCRPVVELDAIEDDEGEVE